MAIETGCRNIFLSTLCPERPFNIYINNMPAKMGSVGNDKSTGIAGKSLDTRTDKGVKKTVVSNNSSIFKIANQTMIKAKGIEIL